MTRRRQYADDPERRRPEQVDDLPMWAPTSTEVGLAARDATADRHTRDIARLIPLALELAAKAGASGVTVSDLRIVAVQRGLLTGQETGRSLSFLGAVMQKAGLEATSGFRRSDVMRSHGNPHRIFRAPQCPVTRDSIPSEGAA